MTIMTTHLKFHASGRELLCRQSQLFPSRFAETVCSNLSARLPRHIQSTVPSPRRSTHRSGHRHSPPPILRAIFPLLPSAHCPVLFRDDAKRSIRAPPVVAQSPLIFYPRRNTCVRSQNREHPNFATPFAVPSQTSANILPDA